MNLMLARFIKLLMVVALVVIINLAYSFHSSYQASMTDNRTQSKIFNDLFELGSNSNDLSNELIDNQGLTIGFNLLRIFRRARESTASGSPSNTRGAARRGKCSTNSTNLFAIVPIIPNETDIYGEQILQKEASVGFSFDLSPTIWLYISKLNSEIKTIEFMIQEYIPGEMTHIDAIDKPLQLSLYSSNSQDPIDTALFGIDLSLAGIQLEYGKEDHWYLSLICSEDKRIPSRESSIDSWIVINNFDQDLQNELEDIKRRFSVATGEKIPAAYYESLASLFGEKYGLWYDAITALIELKTSFSKTEILLDVLSDRSLRHLEEHLEEIVDKPVYVIPLPNEWEGSN